MSRLLRLLTTRRSAWLIVALAIAFVGAAFVIVPSSDQSGYPSSGLPSDAQSQQVAALEATMPAADATAAIVVYTRDGAALTPADLEAINASAARLASQSLAPQSVRPVVADDGQAAMVTVPLSAAAAQADVGATATTMRSAAREGLPAGLMAELTGPIGFQADIAGAFAGADIRLLLVTAAIVAVLLMITYRSPVAWIVPLAVIACGDGLARVLVAWLGDRVGLHLDASTSGIMSVLVFGAGTNYALLLMARYREALRSTPQPGDAMRQALRGAGPAIIASGGTVALSLLTMLLASLGSNRSLGFACGAGVTIAVVFALGVLPPAMVLCGRGVFWPLVPRYAASSGEPRRGIWLRLGEGVRRRPALVAAGAVLVLAALALGMTGYRTGLPLTEQLLGDPESVAAQEQIDHHFPEAASSTAVIMAPSEVAAQSREIASQTAGIGDVVDVQAADGWSEMQAALPGDPQSPENVTAIRELRAAFAQADGAVSDTLVGGTDAQALDERDAAAHDQRLIMPLILAVVFLVLMGLLRSLVAPVLLIATVLASFAAAIGAGTWLFTTVLGYAAFDTSVTLFAFLFLVALGVDYNIFLTTRAREARQHLDTRTAMVQALASTGGVITSAGVLLAAVFAVLGVLPVIALAQIGVIVCFGVLLDTLLVRTALVPALVFLTGDRFWWPGRLPASQ